MMRKQDYGQAVVFGERAVAVGRASQATPRDLVGTLANLAFAYSYLGRHPDAVRAADLVSKRYGDRHTSMATNEVRTARIRLAQGRLQEAKEEAQSALGMRLELLGENHAESPGVSAAAADLERWGG